MIYVIQLSIQWHYTFPLLWIKMTVYLTGRDNSCINLMVKGGGIRDELSSLSIIAHGIQVPNKYTELVILAVSSIVVWLTVPSKYGATVVFAISFFVSKAVCTTVACLILSQQ